MNIIADIIDMVTACNSNNPDKHLQYVDMYGYTFDGHDTLWEEYDREDFEAEGTVTG